MNIFSPKPKKINVTKWRKILMSLPADHKPCRTQSGDCLIYIETSDIRVNCEQCRSKSNASVTKFKKKLDLMAPEGKVACKERYQGCLGYVEEGGTACCSNCWPKKKATKDSALQRTRKKREEKITDPDMKICLGERAGCLEQTAKNGPNYCSICRPLILAKTRAARFKRLNTFLENGRRQCIANYPGCEKEAETGVQRCKSCKAKLRFYSEGRKARLVATLKPGE